MAESDLSGAVEPRHTWRWAFIWALPMALWIAAFCGTGLGFAAQALEWKHDHESWRSTIQSWRDEGHDEIADPQQETLDADDRRYFFLVTGLALGFAASIGIAWLYRRKVPPARRGGLRAMVLGVVICAVLALAGFVLLGMAMKGAITG
ncbi:MAG: hypothetical protein JST54_27740 [Deltaproteobacteria bacterium]|nr:hypothetical protein [Deltaproteobacteria bacterium]